MSITNEEDKKPTQAPEVNPKEEEEVDPEVNNDDEDEDASSTVDEVNTDKDGDSCDTPETEETDPVDSTEAIFSDDAEKPQGKFCSWANIALAVILPLTVGLAIAFIRMKSSGPHQVTSSSSLEMASQLTCGCTSCSSAVLESVTSDGTTCWQEISNLMSRLGLEESQACMLVGQQYPNACSNCDASVCNQHVGNCGCPDTCDDALLSTLVTDQAGSHSCKDRMQFMMFTRDVDEFAACDFVSDEFPDVCGAGCSSTQCQLNANVGASNENYFKNEDNLGEKGTGASTGSDICPEIVWQDEFDGSTLDTSIWEYQTGDGCDLGLCGWGNAEWQEYQSDNAYISDGQLIVEARNDNGLYSSGRIRTKGLVDFKYGYMEASIQIPRGQGLWSAFWALPTEEVYGQWPLSGEIDIMENIGREADTVHGTIHYGDAWPGNLNTGERVQLPNRDEYASAFHNYAVFWEEDRLRWLLDGTQYSQKTPDDIAPYNWPFNEKFHFVINLAIGGNWPGNPDNSTSFPQQMKIDFVRIYDKPFGRLTGPAVVNENEQDIVFELEGGLSDFTYSWSVPSDASITTSNPSSSASISVDFGTESGYVAVEATSSKCGATKTFSMPVLVGGEFLYTPGATVVDCGCPDTCTSSILDSLATDTSGAYSCRERINWVMANRYLVEKAACEAVYDEFPSECTCDPSSCS